MPFEYEKPAAVDGDWVTMTDLAKMAEPVTLRVGFKTPDPTNTFKGQALPRNIVAGKVSNGDAIKVSVPTGYGRDDLVEKADAYLKENPDETIQIRFVAVPDSRYVDIEVAQ